MLRFAPHPLSARSLLLPALALCLLVTGCASKVVGGGEGGSGGGDDGGGGIEFHGEPGDGGSGGGVVIGEDEDAPCTAYGGAGCVPGDTFECGSPPEVATGSCYLTEEKCVTAWTECYTPLVLSFDQGPVTFHADAAHTFDLAGLASVVTDWPTARTPWLALDRDGDGRITDGSELFGSMTILPGGGRASNGFQALRALDDDGDGQITAKDAGFARLLVWSDRDGDRASTTGELAPAGATLVAIDLGYAIAPRCDTRGNCEVERASFRYRDAAGVEQTGAVIDVHLRGQN